jgi:hypothetical protein
VGLAVPIAPPTFVVVATHYVVPPPRFHEDPYTEIVAGQSHDADAPRITLITRDPAIAGQAIALEGSDTRVALSWRVVPEALRRRLVVEAIS